MTKKKHATANTKNATRSTRTVRGMTRPQTIMTMSATMRTVRFTGTYVDFRSRVSEGSACSAYACRFCTRSNNTGVVNTHSSCLRPLKLTFPPTAPLVLALSYATYQSRPSHISLCVQAATAEMNATWRLSRVLFACTLHAAALRLKSRATTKIKHAIRAWCSSTWSDEELEGDDDARSVPVEVGTADATAPSGETRSYMPRRFAFRYANAPNAAAGRARGRGGEAGREASGGDHETPPEERGTGASLRSGTGAARDEAPSRAPR